MALFKIIKNNNQFILIFCVSTQATYCMIRIVAVLLQTIRPRLSSRIVCLFGPNGSIFRVTGPLWGEFTGHRWIPHTKASNAKFDVFSDVRRNKRYSKQSWGWWFATLSCSLWRHCNVMNTRILTTSITEGGGTDDNFSLQRGWRTFVMINAVQLRLDILPHHDSMCMCWLQHA